MAIFQSTPRLRRHRQPPETTTGEKEPFFSKNDGQTTLSPPKTAFFQPKLTIGQPGDPYEREADAVADAVVNQRQGADPGAVKGVGISSVQRLATEKEDKMPATNDGRMAQDKEIQRKEVPGTSTPVPKAYKVEKDDLGAVIQSTGVTAGVQVIILPDTTGETHDGADASTALKVGWETPGWQADARGIVHKLSGVAQVTLTIQTIYLPDVDPAGDSGYGKGTTKQDMKAGNKSLRFHEGSHGSEAILFIKKHAIPKFKGKIGQNIEQYRQAVTDFDQKMTEYTVTLQSSNLLKVDCVGTPKEGC